MFYGLPEITGGEEGFRELYGTLFRKPQLSDSRQRRMASSVPCSSREG